MAEEIILLEEEQISEEESNIPKKEKFDKKIIIVLILIVVILLLLILSVFLIPKRKTAKTEEKPQTIEISSQKFKNHKIDAMIAKANALYENGDKKSALKIYENIALYSQTLSNYNLGVSQMKQKKYEEAKNSFEKALQNKENITPSAINLAVCYLYLGDEKKFKYYIDYAKVFLSEEAKSPLYDYYLGLIDYYLGFYPEASNALSRAKNIHYIDNANYLRAKIMANYGELKISKNLLMTQKSYDNNITLGMLEAKMGDFVKAKYYLSEAAKNKEEHYEIDYAIALLEARMGNYKDTSEILEYIRKAKGDDFLNKLYPIITTLNPELFDQNLAQKNYDKNFLKDKKDKYDTLFYFTPYKVFNASSTIDLLNKASVGLYLDDTSSADSFLKSSKNMSYVNMELTRAIKDSLEYNIINANKRLQKLVKTYSQHSILHFDLALSYAHLGKYDQAKKHFLTSYHLDPKNHLAGLYALMCGDILDEKQLKFESNFVENLNLDMENTNYDFYAALFALYKNDITATLNYIEKPCDDNDILEHITKAILAHQIDRKDILKNSLNTIKTRLNDDVMANMLYFALTDTSKNIKQYAKNIQLYFLNNELNILSLFNGSSFLSKKYTKLMQQAGLLNQVRFKLKTMLDSNPKLQVGILQALAYVSIYSGDFEEAFYIYNTLIDEYGIKDSNTLFLASVASIGAGHNNSAIALLELARIDDTNNKEARLALALLYLQDKNYESAIFQFGKVGVFKSEFFSFDINHKKDKNATANTSN